MCLTCLTLVPALNSFQDQGSGKCRSPQLRIGALGPQLFPHQRWWWIGMFPGEKGNLSLRQTQASCLISKHQELYFEWTATSMSSPANLLHLLHSFLLSVFSWPEMGPVSHLQLHSSLNQLSARTFFGWGSLRWDISQDPNIIVYTLGSPQGLGRRGRISRQDRPPNCQIFIFGGMSGNIYLSSVIFAPIFCRRLKPCTCLGLVSNHPTDITLLSIIAARDRSCRGTLGSGMPQGQGWNSSSSETWQNCLTGMGGCGRCPQAVSHASLSPWEAIRSSFSSPAGRGMRLSVSPPQNTAADYKTAQLSLELASW